MSHPSRSTGIPYGKTYCKDMAKTILHDLIDEEEKPITPNIYRK